MRTIINQLKICFISILAVVCLPVAALWSAGPAPGDLPVFHLSLLDLPEELNTAREDKKLLMLYFWQEGCPYCSRFEKNVLTHPAVEAMLKKRFYPIEMNMFGDKEAIDFKKKSTSEKRFAQNNDIQFTPTTVFFDEKGVEVFKVPGYWNPPHFIAAMKFVSEGYYRKMGFQQYLRDNFPTVMQYLKTFKK